MYYVQVHYQCSVKRVCERVNKGYSTLTHKAFTTIANAIPTVTTQCHVETILQVLCSEKPLQSAIEILPKALVLEEYRTEHRNEKWKTCKHWCNWWMRPMQPPPYVTLFLQTILS